MSQALALQSKKLTLYIDAIELGIREEFLMIAVFSTEKRQLKCM
jgi:hypothetical protein